MLLDDDVKGDKTMACPLYWWNKSLPFKDWWHSVTQLFHVEIEVSLFTVEMVISTFFLRMGFKIGIHNPFCSWKYIFLKVFRFTQYKLIEIGIMLSNDLITGIVITKNIHLDHTPFDLEVSILGITLHISYYDGRHWDSEKNTYKSQL